MIIDNNLIEIHKLEIEIENTGHITNTYVIKDKATSQVCVIDPASNEKKIKQAIDKIEGKLTMVIITHSHADHIAALARLVENEDIKVYVHTLDYEGLFNKELNLQEIVKTTVSPVEKTRVIKLEDKDEIILGNIKFEVIHTPGHTNGSICIVDRTNTILYSGDTIFENTYGRTDLVTGNHESMKLSLNKIFEEFEDIIVLPGHGNEFNLKNTKRRIKLLFAYKG